MDVAKREENQVRAGKLHVAMPPCKDRAFPVMPLGIVLEAIKHTKARIYSKVEHPFHVMWNLFRRIKIC